MTAIEATELTKRYGNTIAVDGLNLSIPEGVVYGFLGPNGAGKTTTMSMLTTLTRPTSGTAHVSGEPITDRDTVTRQIGYLPEEPPLFDELTGREQLEYIAGLRDLSDQHAHERMNSLLEALDLAEDANKRIDDYSKGMRQKTAFIQAILHQPAVLFLDEPTSGLDPRAARTLREMIHDLADSGTSIFLSTHILPVVDELANTVGVLYDGRLVAEGPPADLKTQAETGEQGSLEDVFLEVTSDDPVGAHKETDG